MKRSFLLSAAALFLTSAMLFTGCSRDKKAPEPPAAAESRQEALPASAPESAPSSVAESIPESTVESIPASASESAVESAPESVPESLPESAPDNPESVSDTAVQYYFRNKKLLDQHYEKHGRDMGFASAKEYEKAASDVVNNPEALHKTEKEDGDFVYYVEATNEFVILSTDGYLRTYFLPDRGKAYYDRQ